MASRSGRLAADPQIILRILSILLIFTLPYYYFCSNVSYSCSKECSA